MRIVFYQGRIFVIILAIFSRYKNFMSNTTNQQAVTVYSPNTFQMLWQRGKKFSRLLGSVGVGLTYALKVNQQKLPPAQVIPYVQKFCKKVCQSLDVEVIAVEPIPQNNALWASNHISWLDIPVVGGIIPTFFLSKAEIGRWPVIGWLARTGNTLFIKRGSGDSNAVTQQMTDFLSKGYPVVFFPEATTTNGKGIRRLQGKLLQSAMNSNVPIQPIVICYVNHHGKFDEAIPYYGKISMAESVKKVVDNRPAKAYVLPLEAIDPNGKTLSEITTLLQERMTNGLKRLHEMLNISFDDVQ